MKKAFSGGALILAEMDGKEFSSLVNADIVKKYYAWGNQEKRLTKVENPKGRLWQVKQKEKKKRKRKRFKAKTRKGGLNHTKKEKRKRSSWKPEKAAWPRKEVPRLKTRKGDVRQWKSIGACEERDLYHKPKFRLVRRKTEAEVYSERTKDIS